MCTKLVSILTPAYNTSAYIGTLLESVLKQSYPNIEMIVINDGSTDNIEEVILSYKNRFENKGFSLKYLSQENSGQSVAIQNGLNIIRGEYLAWPDSDDYYESPDSIAKMVNRLESLDDSYGMVRTQENVVLDRDRSKILYISGLGAKEKEDKTLFNDCLYIQNGYYFCPGAYMLKVNALKTSSKLPIYTEKDAGQNWQLMLPVLYRYKCSTILEPLYTVVSRESSHSRQNLTLERQLSRISTYERTILSTLDRINGMSSRELNEHKRNIKIKYAFDRIQTILINGGKNFDKDYKFIKSENRITIKLWSKCFLAKIGLYRSISRIINKIV